MNSGIAHILEAFSAERHESISQGIQDHESHCVQDCRSPYVCVLGSMNADYVVRTPRLPHPGETVMASGELALLPGGKSANQATAASKLGAAVCLLAACGNDHNGEFLMESLKNSGVHTEQIVVEEEFSTGTTVITVDDNAENTIVYSPGANAQVTADYVRAHKETIVHAAVLGLCLESPMDAVIEASRIAHESQVPVLLNNSPFQPILPPSLIEQCDILLVNEHECAQMLQIAEPEDWMNADWMSIGMQFANLGFNTVIVTLGKHGSMVISMDENGSIAATYIDSVPVTAVDTTGCGDAFMGTLLAGLAGKVPLVDSAKAASYVAAYVATGRGAASSYGTTADIMRYFA